MPHSCLRHAAAFAKSPWPRLGAIAALAVGVHGYHLGVDDSAIYVPAIKRVADPSLYPFGAEFFLSHARFSIFAGLVGGSARLGHLPIDAGDLRLAPGQHIPAAGGRVADSGLLL